MLDMLFDDLPKTSTIVSRIKDMDVSASTSHCREDMATNVKERQTVALKVSKIFRITLNKSVNVNVISRFAIVTRHCYNPEAHEELCRLKVSVCRL